MKPHRSLFSTFLGTLLLLLALTGRVAAPLTAAAPDLLAGAVICGHDGVIAGAPTPASPHDPAAPGCEQTCCHFACCQPFAPPPQASAPIAAPELAVAARIAPRPQARAPARLRFASPRQAQAPPALS